MATQVVRVDYADEPIRMHSTPEGYISGEAKVARIGIQAYQDGDGNVRREYRPTAEVFAADAIGSFRQTPVTFGHPSDGLVTSDNAKRLSVGFVGENIRVDGEWLVMPITITDANTISQIEGGAVELSGGYQTEIVDQTGEFDGQAYDAIQTDIRGNHVAVVQQARAGSDARLNLDAADAVAINQQPEVKKDMADPKTVTVRVDGIEYEAAPEVERHITKQAERIDAAEQAKAEAEKATETEKARADAAEAERDQLKEKHTDAAIGQAVQDRLKLERDAATVLGDADLTEHTDRQIKEQAITTVDTDAKLDGQSDDYLAARFDAALATHKRFDDAGKAQRETAAKRDDGQREDAASKHKSAVDAMQNQWKTQEAK